MQGAAQPRLQKVTGGVLIALWVGALSSPAWAQSDVERPPPNVMLLVDTSGSMEFRAEDNELPECTPGNPGAVNEKSRWIELVEVMTGTFGDYSCFPMDRSSVAFRDEYSLDSQPPYDLNYVNPFNRVISNNCTVGPGVLPDEDNPYEYLAKSINTFEFSAPATVTRPSNLAAHPGCSDFDQQGDGILDIFKEKIRFGLMTFDTHTNAGTGVDLDDDSMDVTTGMAGTWSYFLNDTPVQGKPAECSTMQMQEVGARNAAAPPWEGRMVAFGAPRATTGQTNARNEQIQQILLASRPYGATPIAGMLHDAREFFWYDNSTDPFDTSEKFGPNSDIETKATDCRRSLIILLSDGEPNLDLRTHCENTPETAVPGVCPYEKPEDIAAALVDETVAPDPDQIVKTVVIGFALNRVTPAGESEIPCAELTEDHCNDSANDDDRAIQACCTLNKIAAAGGGTPLGQPVKTAYFPQNGAELKTVFSRILKDQIINLTTRTSAVFSNAAATSDGGAHQFSSSFRPLVEEPWAGNLVRTRITCEEGVPEEQPVSVDAGDDFASNVNSGAGDPRRFFTYVPAGNASATLRATITSDPDGLGTSSGSQTALLEAAAFVTEVPAVTMDVDEDDCSDGTDELCRDAILGWNVGLPANTDGETRCADPGADCNVFGAIYHSTPVVVPGRPNELLRDESYTAFARQATADGRPSVLYANTVDGQLHAFKTAPQVASEDDEVNENQNNELWSFFPPAALPVLHAQYPNTPATLLDGPIQVRDVPARLFSGRTLFERTQADAQAATGLWRTLLLTSFGKGQVGSGYFALDVTAPEDGPKFLWQLTLDDADAPLFGEGGTGLITTVFLKSSASDSGREVAVAVLPGGDGGTRASGLTASGPLMAPEDDTFEASPTVNEYTGGEAARSLTVVRLDSGEVIRSFRTSTLGTSLDSSRITEVVIPAAIVGKPAAFPGEAGAVADRVFVGDREGRLWRLDVSKSNPAEWTMKVFFDAYYDSEAAPDKRQPIELAPVVSVDGAGNITVAAATGEQRIQTLSAGMLNRIVSLTEVLDENNEFQAKVNWIETLGCPSACGAGQYVGERVTGPMSLFGGSLFFASSTPAASTADQCAIGQSRVWGLDYQLSMDEAEGVVDPDPLSGAAGALPIPEGETENPKSNEPSEGVVFGVSIEQQPSCSTELETFEGDPYLGDYGDHTALSAITPGKFFLVFQVGGVSGSTSNKVTTEKVELDPPRNTVWADSWAPIFE
jgi:type IV pilus assembly protein PilY1